ncbi:MAG: hypothetical protein LH616_16130 [Ilumatobacteraceae bacterium]|nr:hypothetical protein [Ilumatobacteraceae bacterium]
MSAARPISPLSRLFLPLPKDRLGQRIARCVAGLTLFGLGISCFLTAELGVAPWDVFHQGLERKTGIPIGIIIEITGVFILLLWIPLRERMGLGTLLNAVQIGLVVFLIDDHLPHTEVMVLRVGYMLAGLLSIAIGSGFYIGAGLGSGPRDGLMLGISKHGISIRVARTAIELIVLAAGIALGGTIGIGTVAFTFGIGPLVHVFLPRMRLKGETAALQSAH